MDDRIVLHVKGVHHDFGVRPILWDIDLEIARGQTVALVGPSGCGKSTLLRAIVGTHPPRRGDIVVFPRNNGCAGHIVRGPSRERGIVYQQYSLFPFLTALENVAVGLMLDRTSLPYRFFCYAQWRRIRKSHLALAMEYLEKVELAHAANLYPSSMSGGMRQRVAVAQALILKPEILLLDEPFGALDEATREDLQRLLLTLYSENCEAVRNGEKPAYTIVIVTHELNEAIYVGDRVVGLSQYWDWQSEGHEKCPGATIVYDRGTPVEKPDKPRDYEAYATQRKEIIDVVFDPDRNEKCTQYRTFWDEVKAGKVQGVLAAQHTAS